LLIGQSEFPPRPNGSIFLELHARLLICSTPVDHLHASPGKPIALCIVACVDQGPWAWQRRRRSPRVLLSTERCGPENGASDTETMGRPENAGVAAIIQQSKAKY